MTDTATRPAPIQIQQRDIDGLVLCGEHGGAPYDLLAAALDVAPVRLRGITARWRRAGYAATGQLGPGPAWCWLTASGMADTGLGYRPGPPSLGRVQHVRALLAVRLALRAGPDWQQHRPWWQSERRIRRKGPFAGRHLPDAEVWWPAVDRRARRAGVGDRDRTDRQDRRPHRRGDGRAGRRRVRPHPVLHRPRRPARRHPRRRRPPRRPDHHPRPSPGRLYPRRTLHPARALECAGKALL